MRKSLYVITHKEIKNIFPKDRKIMLVGAVNKEVPAGYYTDYSQQKRNISNKNANYCELSGLYYFINNDTEADVFGLEHYRRLFVKRKFYLFKFPFLKEKDIDKILLKYDIILPKISKLGKSIYQQYSDEHFSSDLDKVINIIDKKYPDYSQVCKKVLSANETYFCNMFIGKKEIIQDYGKWLFDILFELENIISKEVKVRDVFQQRVYGFLSERLFTIWLEKNKQIKRYECNV